jgi:hypothetical protein
VRKKAILISKADLSKAFDFVAWPFLLKVLEHMGFTNAWLNWTSALLRSASTHVLLNGTSGRRICYALCQGDLLSPMVFILVMEVSSAMFCKADSWALMEALGARKI